LSTVHVLFVDVDGCSDLSASETVHSYALVVVSSSVHYGQAVVGGISAPIIPSGHKKHYSTLLFLGAATFIPSSLDTNRLQLNRTCGMSLSDL
jgi:hypothetical protein